MAPDISSPQTTSPNLWLDDDPYHRGEPFNDGPHPSIHSVPPTAPVPPHRPSLSHCLTHQEAPCLYCARLVGSLPLLQLWPPSVPYTQPSTVCPLHSEGSRTPPTNTHHSCTEHTPTHATTLTPRAPPAKRQCTTPAITTTHQPQPPPKGQTTEMHSNHHYYQTTWTSCSRRHLMHYPKEDPMSVEAMM